MGYFNVDVLKIYQMRVKNKEYLFDCFIAESAPRTLNQFRLLQIHVFLQV